MVTAFLHSLGQKQPLRSGCFRPARIDSSEKVALLRGRKHRHADLVNVLAT